MEFVNIKLELVTIAKHRHSIWYVIGFWTLKFGNSAVRYYYK